MNALELMERVGGEVLGHKIRAVIGGEIVVIARMEGTDFALTEEGQLLANQHSNEVIAEAKAPRARKTKDTTSEPVAVESADVEPEL